jgi:hypothetical protein
MVDMFHRCPIQFQRRYGARFGIWPEEEIIPPSVAAGIGLSVHRSVEVNLKNKKSTKDLLPLEHVIQIARDEFESIWTAGMLLTDEEAARMEGTKGEAIDMSVALSRLHHGAVAPKIDPEDVEERFVIQLDGYPFDMAGTIDVREKKTIRDTKTRGKRDPDEPLSLQMRMYSLGHKVLHGSTPEEVRVDVLLKLKNPAHELYAAKPLPDSEWYAPLYRRIESMMQVIDLVRRGLMDMPAADPSAWCCTARYCGWARMCPAWSGRE